MAFAMPEGSSIPWLCIKFNTSVAGVPLSIAIAIHKPSWVVISIETLNSDMIVFIPQTYCCGPAHAR